MQNPMMPMRAGDTTPTRRVPVAWVLLTGAGAALAGLLLSAADGRSLWVWFRTGELTGYSFRFWSTLPWVWTVTVLATSAGVWAGAVDRDDPARGPRHAAIVRTLSALALAVVSPKHGYTKR